MADVVGNVISGLALVVSGVSLFVALRTARRAAAATAVTVWIDLHATNDARWFEANLTVKNLSHIDVAVEKLAISLPDYRLGDRNEATVDDGYGNRVLPDSISVKSHYMSMSLPVTVPAGETQSAIFLIFQPAHSRKKKATVNVMYQTKEPKPRWRSVPVTVRTRSDL